MQEDDQIMKKLKDLIQRRDNSMNHDIVNSLKGGSIENISSLVEAKVMQQSSPYDAPYQNRITEKFKYAKKNHETVQQCLYHILQKRSEQKFVNLLLQSIINQFHVSEVYFFKQILDSFECVLRSKMIKKPTNNLDEIVKWFQKLPENQLITLTKNNYEPLQLFDVTHGIRNGEYLCLLKMKSNANYMKFFHHYECHSQFFNIINLFSQGNGNHSNNQQKKLIYFNIVSQYLHFCALEMQYQISEVLASTLDVTGIIYGADKIDDGSELHFKISSSGQISIHEFKYTINNTRSKIKQLEKLTNKLLTRYNQKLAKRFYMYESQRVSYSFTQHIVIDLEFDSLFRLIYISDKIEVEFRQAFKMRERIRFHDPIHSIFEANPQFLLNLQERVIKAEFKDTENQVEFSNENQKCLIQIKCRKLRKISSICVTLTHIPGKRSIAQLMTIFRNKVRLVTTLYMATSAFRSKQMILKNVNYHQSGLVEYLSERDLKTIMLSNEAVMMKIDVKKYYSESMKQHEKKTEKFNKLLQTLQPYKPHVDILAYDEKLKGKILHNNFNILEVSDSDEKISIVWALLQMCPFSGEVNIPKDLFCNFITILKSKYNKNSNTFHNFLHGITVMHGCFMLQRNSKVSQWLSELERFTLVLSGLCHDTDHNATGNQFEINAQTKLAIRYSDSSVLENHHICTTYKILNQEQANIFKNITIESQNEIRLFMVNNILATDNKNHLKTLNDVEMKFQQLKDDETIFKTQENKLILSGFLLHSADFFGAIQKFSVSNLWSTKVNQEFTAQLILEGKLGIPQTPYFKGLDNAKSMAKNEIGFLKVIVLPLWEVIHKFTAEFEDLILNTNETIKTYEKICNQD